nr:hypothetical protein [Pseudomonadota bacterium]
MLNINGVAYVRQLGPMYGGTEVGRCLSLRTFSQPLQATRLPVIHGQSRLRAGSFHKNKGLLTPWLMAVKYQA